MDDGGQGGETQTGDENNDLPPGPFFDPPPKTPPLDMGIQLEEVNNVQMEAQESATASAQPAHIAAQDKPIITRLHVLEYLSGREWWYEGQNNLCFTVVLWVVFILIMYLRSGVSVSYDLHQAVAQHMENIIAHPHLSGIALRTVSDMPVPCRCACQSAATGLPSGPCDPYASEHINFLGKIPANSHRLPALSNPALLAANIDPTNLGDQLGQGNDNIDVVTWDSMTSLEQVWFWVEHGFIPDVWTPRSQQQGTNALQGLVAQKNLIIGGVRARQERAAWANDCDEKVDTELDTFYGMNCRASEDATAYYGPVGAASSNYSASAFRPSKIDESFYDALFGVELPISNAAHTAAFCRQHHWIDSATRSLDLQSVALNAEVGMFAIVHIKFQFLYGGGIDKRVDVHTIHATGQKLELQDIIPELIWFGMILLLLRQEIVQCCYETYHKRALDYWLDLWCAVDWISILVGFTIAAFWFWQISSINTISDEVAALPRAPFASGLPSNIDQYHTQWQKVLDDASSVFGRKQYYQLCLFWYTMIITGRFLKGFLSQSKLAMLQLTLGYTFWDVTHLLVFFVVIFLNFLLGGHIMFGPELESWSTLVKSASTAIQMLLGTFAFDDMYENAPVAATIWFWSFLLSMIFILMNIMFAIIGDYFHVFRRSIGATPTIIEDMKVSLREMWWRLGWRRIQYGDAEAKEEYCDACCYSPYYGVLDELMTVAQAPDKLERDARHSCLGVKLGRRHMEALSVEGLNAATNVGFVEATSKGVQELGAEIMAADHLLEMTYPMVEIETKLKNESQLTMMRHFVELLRRHREELDAHCQDLEHEVFFLADGPPMPDGRSGLFRYLEILEASVNDCLKEFKHLKTSGVRSLAPAYQALPRPGSLVARQAQEQSLVAPGALMRAIETQAHNATRLPPEPPDMLASNAHANAFLMNSKHTKALLSTRGALKNSPMTSLPETNVTLMLENNVFDDKKDEETQGLLALEAGNSRPSRFGNLMQAARASSRLRLTSGGQTNKPEALMDNRQASGAPLAAIADHSNQRPQQASGAALAGHSNQMPQAIMDQGNANNVRGPSK